GNTLEHLFEAWPTPAFLRRKIGAAPEGLPLGGEEHGEGPATLLAQQGERRLIDAVEVGPFLAVDLDVDIEFVHQPGDLVVPEALVGHGMAPMTSRVSDREQDGRVLALGFG